MLLKAAPEGVPYMLGVCSSFRFGSLPSLFGIGKYYQFIHPGLLVRQSSVGSENVLSVVEVSRSIEEAPQCRG